MSNNSGTFVPTATPVTVVGAPKPVLGHVVQATSSSMKFGGEHMHIPSVNDQPKERYKWHTVVDGISKFIFPTNSGLSQVGGAGSGWARGLGSPPPILIN